jgi:hypothetical protein
MLVGVVVAAAVLLVNLLARRDSGAQPLPRGNFGACANLTGDAARACYRREFGRELAAVSAAVQNPTLRQPASTSEVTFASLEEPEPLLCDLHARVGVVDAQVPSWLGWTEPLVETAPRS